MAAHTSPEARDAAMTVLEANGGNIKKTSRETGIRAETLRRWRSEGRDRPPPEKSAALIDSFLEKARAAREALLDRMVVLADTEADMFKVSGAFKIVTEAVSDAEFTKSLADRVRVSEPDAAPEKPGAPHGNGVARASGNAATA